MPAGNLLAPIIKVLVASTAHTTTGASTAFEVPVGVDTYQIVLRFTAVTGTSPTCDAQLQTSFDAGTTYINLPIRSTQVTAAGLIYWVFKLGLGGNEVALESPAAATGGTLAKNCIFDPTKMKVNFTIGGTNPSFTVTILGFFSPKSGRGSGY